MIAKSPVGRPWFIVKGVRHPDPHDSLAFYSSWVLLLKRNRDL